MKNISALLALILRVLRPSRGVHAAPRRAVREEARAARPRRYVPVIPPARPCGPGYNVFASPWPVVAPATALPPTTVVRRYYVAHEAGQAAHATGKVAA
jgi:hypothetical protein